jgi:outer membrane protein TolC
MLSAALIAEFPPAGAAADSEPMENLIGLAADGSGDVVAIPGAGSTLGLRDCVDNVMTANPTLLAAREERARLQAQITQARSLGLPTLDLGGTWSKGRDPSFVFDKSFQAILGGGEDSELPEDITAEDVAEAIPAATFWRASLNARWELKPGLVYNAVGAAGLGVKRQDVIITGTENEMVEATLSTFYAVHYHAEVLDALDADIEAKQEFLEITERRLGLGLSTPLDSLRAAVALANLVPERRRTAQRLRDAGSTLNIYMGREVLSPLTVSGRLPIEDDDIDPDQALLQLARRPDIQQIQLLEDILRKNRGAQKASSMFRPYLSALGSWGYVTQEFDQLTDRGHDFWSASVALNIPIFDGFLNRGQVKETEANIRRTEYQREDAVRFAQSELSTALGDLFAARENLQATELNLQAAEEALDLINKRYELGKADFLSVLDAQTERLRARGNHILARNEVLTRTAALKRIMGYNPTIPLETIAADIATLSASDGENSR